MSRKYRRPILAVVYWVIGGLILLAGTMASVAWMLGAASWSNAGSLPSGIVGGMAVLLLTLAAALPFFGMAQVISYIGKTAYYTESLSHAMTLSMMEINLTASHILEHLKTIENQGSRPAGTDGTERMAACPFCGARIPLRTLHKGTNVCPECGRTVEME